MKKTKPPPQSPFIPHPELYPKPLHKENLFQKWINFWYHYITSQWLSG